MTTRILDVRTAQLLPARLEELAPLENLQWMSVLKSLTAYQMYRLEMQTGVRRQAVLRFLIGSDRFPRALRCCLDELADRLERLGDAEGPLRVVGRLQRTVREADPRTLEQEALHGFIDDVQLGLAELHGALAQTYFLHRDTAAAERASTAA